MDVTIPGWMVWFVGICGGLLVVGLCVLGLLALWFLWAWGRRGGL